MRFKAGIMVLAAAMALSARSWAQEAPLKPSIYLRLTFPSGAGVTVATPTGEKVSVKMDSGVQFTLIPTESADQKVELAVTEMTDVDQPREVPACQ